jgi:hypothetical protein
MAALKNTLYFFVFIVTIGSLSSCVRDILNLDCGKSILLGTLKFADSTKNLYSNWTGKEILIFKDSVGNLREYFSERNKQINLKNRLHIKTLCDSGFIDKQIEFFESESHITDFVSQTATSTLHLDLFSDNFGENKDSVILFDRFSAGFNNARVQIISVRDKPIPLDVIAWTSSGTSFVADTTILGKNFKNVFYSTSDYYKSAIYFQKTKMIIGYKEAGKTWLLDRIK